MSDMTFDGMVEQMTPTIYESLKQSMQLRKWPDGRVLTSEQVELCMEAVIKYEVHNNVPAESRVGFIDNGTCGPRDGDDTASRDEPEQIKWVN
ncbi:MULTISPECIES: DUF1315 family protein [Cobetia]|uniref:YeaC family protein n=1 Tax=Cobetia TaxID=204286 RepID=UPI0008665DB5|nr:MULTISPECIES: DUF1315 family protein [Cobetia]AOM01870.1 hypothetical protein BFX80_11960 [Cobetia marina]